MRIFLAACLFLIAVAASAGPVRIKDLVEFDGVRGNDLVGYGLVVGLNGTGDGIRNAPFTEEIMANMLERLGVNVSGEEYRPKNVAAVFVTLAVSGIIYAALVSMVQPDLKKLIAYSSVSHLGFVMLGIWGGTVESVQGAIMVMIAHGLSTGALFFLVGMLYERRHTRLLAEFGGVAPQYEIL